MVVPLPNGLFWLIKWGDPNHVSKSWDGVDGSDDFPDFNWVIFRFKMLSFMSGIGRKSNVILVATTGKVDNPTINKSTGRIAGFVEDSPHFDLT